jgi:hypothetical protein
MLHVQHKSDLNDELFTVAYTSLNLIPTKPWFRELLTENTRT